MLARKINLLLASLTLSTLASCSNAGEVPACGSQQAKNILNNMANQVYTQLNVGYTYEHSMDMIRTRKIESSTGMRECAANFHLHNPTNNKTYIFPIVYWVLLLDDSKEPVVENENLKREISDVLFLGKIDGP